MVDSRHANSTGDVVPVADVLPSTTIGSECEQFAADECPADLVDLDALQDHTTVRFVRLSQRVSGFVHDVSSFVVVWFGLLTIEHSRRDQLSTVGNVASNRV